MLRPRNYVARSPMLRKGGVHERCQSGKRQQQKQDLKGELDSLALTDHDLEENQLNPDANKNTEEFFS